MRLYYRYIRNYNKSRDLLAELVQSDAAFGSFCDQAKDKMDSNPINHYLIMPSALP